MNDSYKQYADFKKKQTDLAELLDESAQVIAELNMRQMCDNLRRLSDKVLNDTFKVQIVGTFKNGKSTFINSILGEEVLPAYALPCTAIVNEVKWGETKKAVVHFRNPLPKQLPSGIPVKALRHMKQHNMENIPPIDIAYDELNDYAVISVNNGKEEIEYESPYEKVEVFWPLPILKNGVQIIDSPGLNECATRTRVTMNYITKADAILFVLDASRILSADEMRVIEHTLREQGFDDPFIIVNKFDTIRQREQEPMKNFVKTKLDGFTSNDFFFVSAINALDGKLDKDESLLESSGMIEFEKALSVYLTEQKGRAKLAQPTRELSRILNDEALTKTIPLQRTVLASSLDSLKEKYEKTKPKLDLLRTKREQLLTRLQLTIEQTKPEFKRLVTTNISNLTDQIPAWVEEYEPQNKVGFLPNKDALATIYQEIAEHINSCIEDSQLEWRKSVLEPVINEKTTEIFSALEEDLKTFFKEIDNINTEITGQESVDSYNTPWDRAASITGGLNLGDSIDSAAAVFSGKNISLAVARSIALEVGALALLNVLGILNPITIIGSLVALFFFSKGKSQGVALKKVKEQICVETTGYFNQSKLENAESVADNICEKLMALASHLTSAIDIEITETENQIASIIEEMEKGKENIQEREEAIDAIENRINILNQRLSTLTKSLIRT